MCVRVLQTVLSEMHSSRYAAGMCSVFWHLVTVTMYEYKARQARCVLRSSYRRVVLSDGWVSVFPRNKGFCRFHRFKFETVCLCEALRTCQGTQCLRPLALVCFFYSGTGLKSRSEDLVSGLRFSSSGRANDSILQGWPVRRASGVAL